MISVTKLCKAKGWPRKILAYHLGVTLRTVMRWERQTSLKRYQTMALLWLEEHK